MIKKGDEIEVSVTGLSSEGKGIVKLADGFVIFVSGSLPGDRSLVKLLKKKSGYAEAKTLKIISPSPDRIEALCRHFYICGGCKTQDLKYEKQLEYKAKAAKDAFEKIGGFENLNIPPVLPSPEIFFYRNKMEFTFSDDKWWESPPSSLQEAGSNSHKATLDKKVSEGSIEENIHKAPLDKGELGGLKDEFEILIDEKWIKERNLKSGNYFLPYSPKLKEASRYLRSNMTSAERYLWEKFLRKHEYNFLRQRPIDHFIADFYCPSARVIIEIDGEIHNFEDAKELDDNRSQFLEKNYKLKIIRFKNEAVLNKFEEVCEIINEVVIERAERLELYRKLTKESLPSSLQEAGSNSHKATLDKKVPEGSIEENIHKAPLDKGGLGGLQGFALGLHVPKFHSKIVDIEECFLQSELTAGIVNFTRNFFKERNISVYSTKTHSGFLRFFIIREAKNTGDVMVNLITNEFDERLMNEFGENLKTKFPQITTFLNGISQKKAQVAFSDEEHIIFGKGYITEKLSTVEEITYTFKIASNSFFQTNTKQAGNLFRIASEFGDYSSTDNVLDLYCGAGAISIFISGKVNKVLGVELVEDAVADARENAELNNVRNVSFIASDIKDFLQNDNTYKNYNKLILDPPRSGLHPKICELLSYTKFDNIIYVSCNPQTQARDLKVICSKGNYKIEKIQPVDMFPHTHHLENIIKLISL